MFKANDRIKLISPIGKLPELQKVGGVFEIVNIIKMGFMIISLETKEKILIPKCIVNTHFEKVEESIGDKPLKGVSTEKIERLMSEANINVTTLFGKTTMVAAQFPNGFVITESSSCVDPKVYSEEEGKRICLEHIKERLWEMEGYFVQEQEYLLKQAANSEKTIKSSESSNRITDEMVKTIFEEIFVNAKKTGICNCSVEEIQKKLKNISEKNNVNYEKLVKKVANYVWQEQVKAMDKLLEGFFL